jgi:hypothetical protein
VTSKEKLLLPNNVQIKSKGTERITVVQNEISRNNKRHTAQIILVITAP